MSEPSELDLARKLACDWHLNAPERRLLPRTGIAGSKLVTAIDDIIDQSCHFPGNWSPDSDFGGIVIEPAAIGYSLHECRETGMGQYTHIGTTHVSTLEEAVRAFVVSGFGPNYFDGVPVDWNR